MAGVATRPIPAPARTPSRRAPMRGWLLATTALLPVAAGPVMAQPLPAPGTGPAGGQVVAGQAAIARTPGRTTITQGTDRAAIDWQQFNVGSQHTVQFVQPNQGSWTLNRVTGPDPSVVAGRVQANGNVAIVNQSGMVFARGAQVDVGGLIASAADIGNENFMAGRMAFDRAPRPGARVENHGTITVADRGLAALVAPGVANSGVIRARLGRVALGAAETFVLDLAGDGLIGIDVTQAVRTAPEGGTALVTNSGVIEAPGGSVLLSAHAASGLVEDLVRQTGRIEAPSLGSRTGEVAIRAEGGNARVEGRVAATGGAGERGGRVALQASGTVAVGGTARVDASGGAGGGQVLVGTTGRGRNRAMARRTIVESGAEIRADATGTGDGGMLALNSLERTEMRGTLSARGGPGGGNGGFVELSGQGVLEATGTVDVRAPAGTNGELLIDPDNIIVSNTALPATPGGLPAGETITVEITTATGSVTADTGAATEWTRISTAAITGFAGTVTLDAARDIVVDDAISKGNGGLTLIAGRDVTLRAAVDLAGALNITAAGGIAMNADAFATSMALAAGTGIAQAAGTVLRHRTDAVTALNLAATVTGSGNVSLTGDNGRILLQTGGTADGDFTVRSTNRVILGGGQTLAVNGAATFTVAVGGNPNANNPGISLQGTLLAESVALSANRDITQAAGSGLFRIGAGNVADAAAELPLTVAVTGSTRLVNMAGANGTLRLDSGSTEAGDFTLRGRALTVSGPLTAGAGGTTRNNATLTATAADGAVRIEGTVTARNLTINAGGAVTQTTALALGGTGNATPDGRLTIRGADGSATSGAGSVTLTVPNVVAELDARATGALAFASEAALDVLQARGAGVTLTGPAITVAGGQPGVAATGAGEVRIIAGSLTVPGSIVAPDGNAIRLRVDALDASGGSMSAGATGTVEIGPRDATFAVQVGTAGNPANTLELATADVEGITAGTIRIGRTTIAGEAVETIEAQGLTVAEAVAPGAALSLLSGAGITVGANVTAPALRIETTGGAIDLGTARLTANGTTGRAITLLSADAITQGAGGLLVASGGAADLVAHAQAGGLDLAGQGGFRLANGGTPAGAAGPRSLYAAGGDVAFATTGALVVNAAAEAPAAGATLSLAARAILLNAPLLASATDGVIDLRAAGGGAASTITQNAGGLLTASLLNLDAAGAIRLDAAANAVGALGSVAFTDGFAYRSAGAFTVATPVAPTGGGDADITFVADAGTLQVNAAIDAGAGTVRLEATTGDIQQAASGAAITAGRVELAAQGNALLAPALPADRNQVAVLGTSTVGGTLAFAAAGDLALDGAIAQSASGGSLAVESGGTLRVNAGASLGFDSIRLVAPGAMTVAGTIGLDQAVPASQVRLGAGAGISQEATGRIVADVLALRATGDADLTAGSNEVRRVAAAASGLVALDTAGTLATANADSVPLPGGPDASIAGVQGASVRLSAEELTIQPATLAGLGAGAWASAADGVLTLRADRLALNSRVAAGDPGGTPNFNGTIVVAPRDAARGISIGSDDTNALFLSQAAVASLVARNIVIGRAETGAGALTVAGAASPLTGVNTVRLQGGSIALDAPFTLATVDGLVTLRAIDGDIVQSAGGAVSASRLSLIADAGSVLLGSPGLLNAATLVSGGVAAGERFVFRADGTYTVAAPGIAATGAEVDLSSATGSILQALGAPILADRLLVAAAADVTLDGGGASAGASDLNRIGSLHAPTAGATLTLRNADPLTVEAAGSTALLNGGVVLEAPGITLAGDVTASTAGGRVVLRTGPDFDAPATGGIAQTGGIIRTQDFSASAGGDIVLMQANEIARIVAGAGAAAASTNGVVAAGGGSFLLSNSLAGLQVAAPVSAAGGGGIAIFSDGVSVAPALVGIAFLAPGGVVQFAPFTAGGTIGLGGSGGLDTTTITAEAIQRVSADRLVIGSRQPTDATSSGTITLRGALDLTRPGGPAALELRSGGDIAADGFALSVARLSAYANGTITIGTADSRIGSLEQGLGDAVAAIRAGGASVRVTSAGADAATGLLTVAAPVFAGGGSTIALQAPDIALNAAVETGAGAAGRIEIRSPRTLSLGGAAADAGTARLTAAELGLLDAQGGTLFAAGPDIRLSGAWTLDPAAAGRLELALTTGGAGTITQTAGGLSAASLVVTALAGAGTVQIAQAGNSLPVVEADALGAVSIATAGALEVRHTSAGGNVAYRGTDITLSTTGLVTGQASIEAPGRLVSLTATAGDISGTAAQAAVRAGSLAASATAGEVRLTGDNAVGTLAATARDGVVFRNTGALTATAVGAGGAGTAVAGDIDIAATSLTLNDILSTGTVRLDAGIGNLLQAAGARLSAATLAATAAGSIRLAGANPDGTARNEIQDLTALAAGGDVTLRNALALVVDLPLAVGTDRVLTLEAPTLTLAGSLSAAGPNGQVILRTGGFAGGAASGGDILQTAGTISAARLAALAGGSITLDRAGNAIGALGGGLDASGVALGLGLSAGGDAALRSNGFGGSATLGVTGTVQVGAGRALTLRADDLAIAAALRAPGGTITLLPVTTDAGIGYVLGGAAGNATAGHITLDEAELAFLPSGTPAAELRLGALGATGSIDILGTVDLVDGANGPRVGRLTLAGDGALTQASGSLLDVAALSALFPNGAVRLDPGVAGNRVAAIEGVTAGGEVLIRGGAGMTEVRGAIAAASGTRVVLRADDLDIRAPVRAPGGAIAILPETAGRGVTLGGTGAGTLALDSAEIARLGGAGETLGAPGAQRLVIGSDGTTRSAGDIRVTGDVPLREGATVRVGTLELVAGTPGTAGGSVRQTGGSVDVATVTGTAQGDFQLGLAGNGFDAATGISAGTAPAPGATGQVALGTAGGLVASDITAPVSVRLSAGAGLTAGGVTAPAILLQGGTVTLAGLIQGADSVTIESAGAVTQQAGALIITDLFTLNGGSVSLPEDNQILEIGDLMATGPVLALNTVLDLLVSGAISANGSLNFTTSQGLTVAPGGGITVTGGPGTASLTAGTGLTYGGLLSTSGGATLAASGALAFTGTGTIGGAASLTGGTTLTLAGALTAGTTAGIDAAGTLQSTGLVQAGGGLALSSGAGMTLGGSHVAGGDLTATAGGGLVATGGIQTGGTATLRANGGTLAQMGTVSAAAAMLAAVGDLEQTGTAAAGGDASLSAGGNLANGGTVVAGGTLTLAAGGALSQAGLAQAGGAAGFSAGGPVTLAGQSIAGGNFDLTTPATATLQNGKIAAGGTVRVSAGQGLTLQAFQIDPTSILLATGGALSVTDSGLVASESIRLAAGSIAIRGGTVTTGTLDVDSTATLTLGGGLYVIGRAVAFSAPGGIRTTSRITVTPRDGVLPAVVFDTRAAGRQLEPLTVVEPDIPGLQPRQQATQVRIPGTEAPGSFGPASSAAAGTMLLDIDAGRSAVFLLLDGGTATGTILAAGRLGIHGTGGSAELNGAIADTSGNLVNGPAAARFADSTRPSSSGALTRYRINGCVVSSINCIVPSQVISIPQAPPQRVDVRLLGGRITDPDVQIPNVADEDY